MVGLRRPDLAGALDCIAGDRSHVRARDLPATGAGGGERNGGAVGGAVEILTMLHWTIYLSFLGVAVLMLLPADKPRAARLVGLWTALGGFALALAGTIQAGGGVTTFCDVAWVPSLGIHYHLAADGISLTLVLLTGIAAVAGILFSWNIEHRAKEFFAFYFALIGGVYGVFLSFDVFLLFVFYELAVIPKYFLIAIWGSTG